MRWENNQIVLETEADPRHAELIVQEMGVKGGKGVDVPDVKDSPEDELSPPVIGKEVKAYRSVTMRAAYLAVDRADISNTAKMQQRICKHRVCVIWLD